MLSIRLEKEINEKALYLFICFFLNFHILEVHVMDQATADQLVEIVVYIGLAVMVGLGWIAGQQR